MKPSDLAVVSEIYIPYISPLCFYEKYEFKVSQFFPCYAELPLLDQQNGGKKLFAIYLSQNDCQGYWKLLYFAQKLLFLSKNYCIFSKMTIFCWSDGLYTPI